MKVRAAIKTLRSQSGCLYVLCITFEASINIHSLKFPLENEETEGSEGQAEYMFGDAELDDDDLYSMEHDNQTGQSQSHLYRNQSVADLRNCYLYLLPCSVLLYLILSLLLLSPQRSRSTHFPRRPSSCATRSWITRQPRSTFSRTRPTPRTSAVMRRKSPV